MLKISSSTEYAVRIMVHLASHPGGPPLTAETLAGAENIPRDYVDQILGRLRRAGLVSSRRGALGGYRLAMAPEAISVGRVMRAVDEAIFEAVCDRYSAGAHQCGHLGGCGIRPVWQRLYTLAEEFLDRVTLVDLKAEEPCVVDRVARLFGAPAGR